MKEINVGIIGCGWFGNVHLQNLLGIEGVTVTALVSGNRQKLLQTAQAVPNAQLFSSHQELFSAKTLPDALVVCVPPAMHGDVEQCAARHGVHLYVEKPLEVALEPARRNAAQIASSGIICSVGYQGRYSPLVQELREKLCGQQVGLASAKWIGDMPQVHWWRDKSLSGGQVVEQATHLVDMLRYLLGDVATVYSGAVSNLNCNVENKSVEDGSSAVLTFRSGAVATVMTGCYNTKDAPADISLQLYTKEQTIDFKWSNKVTYSTKHEIVTKTADTNNHLLAMQQFILAVQTGDRTLVLSDYADALKTFEVTLAANRSMQDGRIIHP